MSFTEVIIESLLSHTYIVAVVAGLMGQEAVLFLTFLQSINGVSLGVLLIVAPLGFLVIGICYYAIGQIKFLKPLGDYIKSVEKHQGLLPMIIGFSNKHPLFALIITKYVYGTRSGLMIYLSTQKMNFWRFILYDLIAIYVWALPMVSIAWYMGRWLGLSGLDILENFFLIVAVAIALVIALDTIIRIIYYFLRKEKIINLK